LDFFEVLLENEGPEVVFIVEAVLARVCAEVALEGISVGGWKVLFFLINLIVALVQSVCPDLGLGDAQENKENYGFHFGRHFRRFFNI
jgi:hypothetical protein